MRFTEEVSSWGRYGVYKNGVRRKISLIRDIEARADLPNKEVERNKMRFWQALNDIGPVIRSWVRRQW